MADWYCGSVQYAAVAQFATSHAYSVGDIVRQLAAPSVSQERCFRCTTAGTSGGTESGWNVNKGGTTTQGTAVFTEITGNSTYGWSAPHATLSNAVKSPWAAAGDTIYVASNHSYTYSVAANYIWTMAGSISAPINVLCVNPAGSVPPVAADITTGAIETGNTTIILQGGSLYCEGVALSSGSGNPSLRGFGGPNVITLKNCKLIVGNSTSGRAVELGDANTLAIELINTTMTFGNAGQHVQLGTGSVIWRDTPSAILGTAPTTLFTNLTNNAGTCRVSGVDLSALGSGATLVDAALNMNVVSLVNCKLGASVTVAATPTSMRASKVLATGCDSSGSSARNEIYDFNGTLTTETTIIRSGGASDGTTPISWKVVTNTKPTLTAPFECFPIAAWNATVGSTVTATVEIENDGTTLQNSDVWLEVEYLGASGNPLASIVSNAPATVLTAGGNLSTSSETWTTTGQASPVKQHLQVTFTPQIAGLVRAVVKVAKASKTIYVDPKITLS